MINVYCDESCHLENDDINVMVLGAIWCPQDKIKEINQEIIEIKKKYNVKPNSEIKWTKVAPSKLQLYKDIVDYFFENKDLHLRCLVVPDKSKLNHKAYNQTHDEWYYKMYFDMLKTIFSPFEVYNVYFDIKDTNSTSRGRKLHEVCCNKMYDFDKRIIKKVQPIRSNEVQIMQIVDIIIGAIGYVNRKFNEDEIRSVAKNDIIELIKQKTSYTLTKTTLIREEKLNIFVWEANYYGQ